MDTAVSNGNFICDSQNHLIELNGYNELLQRVLIRLCVKKGSFVYDENLGSRLYTLKASDANLPQKALSLIREALIDLSEVTVNNVYTFLSSDKEHLELNIILSVNNVEKEVVITV